jgi:hypothetical protein
MVGPSHVQFIQRGAQNAEVREMWEILEDEYQDYVKQLEGQNIPVFEWNGRNWEIIDWICFHFHIETALNVW